jgi:drug/metabolite transporter (DMT)-like permease
VIVATVLAAALLHATWSSVAKSAADQMAGFAVMAATSALLGVTAVGVVALPARAAWPFLAVSGAIHVVYMLLLVLSYRIGDFNQVYPLARGTSPLLVSAVGLLALGEAPSIRRVAGVAVVCVGLAMLSVAVGGGGVANPPAVAAALATGLTITLYTVVDGVGVRRAESALGYAVSLQLLMGVGFLGVVAVIRGRRVVAIDRRSAMRGVIGGLVAAAAYSLVLFAQTQASLGVVSALRETSIVFGALIGAIFLHEPLGRMRIGASLVVVMGVVMIA